MVLDCRLFNTIVTLAWYRPGTLIAVSRILIEVYFGVCSYLSRYTIENKAKRIDINERFFMSFARHAGSSALMLLKSNSKVK